MTVAVVNLADALPIDVATLCTVFPGTNKRTGWNITFAGPAHEKTVALNNEAERKRLERSKEIEVAQVNGRRWKGESIQPEESRREFIEGIVGRIIDWNPVDFGDGPIEFSEKAAVELLMQPKMGAYVAQMVDFLIGEKTFTKASAGN